MIQKQGSIKTTLGCVWSFSRLALLWKFASLCSVFLTRPKGPHISRTWTILKSSCCARESLHFSPCPNQTEPSWSPSSHISSPLQDPSFRLFWMLLLKTLPSADGANKGVPSIEEYVQRIQSLSCLSLVTLGFYVDVCSVNLLTYDVNYRFGSILGAVSRRLSSRLFWRPDWLPPWECFDGIIVASRRLKGTGHATETRSFLRPLLPSACCKG